MAADEIEDGALVTSDALRSAATASRSLYDTPGRDAETKMLLGLHIATLEALAKTKDDLATVRVEHDLVTASHAQMRKEFEAFKGEVRTRYLPRR